MIGILIFALITFVSYFAFIIGSCLYEPKKEKESDKYDILIDKLLGDNKKDER